MVENPRVVQTDAQPAAVIRFTIPRDEIRNVMGPGIAELMAAVTAQGVGPTGPVFSHHFKMDPGTFDFELGVPVRAPVAASGRVRPGQLPKATVARAIYRGPYEGLGPAWGEFEAWIAANGYTSCPDLWECYIAGPEASPNPADYRTQLNRPLRF